MPGVETLHLTSDRDRASVPRRAQLGALLLWTVLVAATVFLAVLAAGTGGVGRLFGGLLVVAALLLCAFPVTAMSQRTGRLVVEQRPESLRLTGASSRWRLTLALLAVGTLVAVAADVAVGVVLVRGEVELRASAIGGVLILLGLSVMLVLIVVQVLRGRIRAPYLELDADGLTHHGMNVSTTVLWKDVTGVRLVADPDRRLVVESRGTPQRTVRSATPGERPVGGRPGAPGQVLLPAASLGSDAALVADLIEDLAGDPRAKAGATADLRAGLATGETLALLRAGRLRPAP